MPQITKLQAQKNPKFTNIFLDHQYAFSLPLEEIYKQKLKTGLQLTQQQIDHLIKLGDYSKILDRAIKYIALRPRSEQELKIWLTTKVKLAEESLTLTKVIEKLKNLNLLNDTDFANWWIEQRTTYKPRGPQMLYKELLQKGLNKQTIEQALQQLPDQTDNLHKLAQKKLRQLKNSSKPHAQQNFKIRNKLIAFLQRKGYHFSKIKPVIDEILKKT